MTYDYKVDKDYLLGTFIKYVKIDTASNDGATAVPSTPGQIEFGKAIVGDLNKIGVTEVEQDKNGYIVARIKGNTATPAIGFIAHLDTSSETSGKDVNPIVHPNYEPSDIKLPKNGIMISLKDNPELKDKKGKTIITSDGTTLLGGDDKSGVAICMETAKFLVTEKDLKHGDVFFIFTPDEEIGHGADLLDVKKLGLACAYTLDSEGHATICEETFCADQMIVHVKGKNTHPGSAKDKMVNAIRVASSFIEKLPFGERPETTEGRAGFVHPLKIDSDVTNAKITCLVRDFTVEGLKDKEERCKKLAQAVSEEYKGSEIIVEIKEQYRNMKYQLDQDPRVVGYLKEACQMTGIKPELKPARGGTDGSRLSYRGLLTPDIAVGYHAMHSPTEWVVLEEMEETAKIVRNLIRKWASA